MWHGFSGHQQSEVKQEGDTVFCYLHAVSEMIFMTRCYFSKTLHWLELLFLVYIITHPKQHWPFLWYRKLFLSSRSFVRPGLYWFASVPGSLISTAELFHCVVCLVSVEAVMCPAICSPRQARQANSAARSLSFAEHFRVCCLSPSVQRGKGDFMTYFVPSHCLT